MTKLRAATMLSLAVLGAGIGGTAQAAGPNDILPEAPAKAVVVRACTSCHQAAQIVIKPHTAAEWDELVGKMMDRGARLTDPEQDQVIDYLATNFGPPGAPAAPAKPK